MRTDLDSSPPGTDTPTAADSRRQRWTLLTMCVATFMISLDLTIVNVALPFLQSGLRLSPGGLEWAVSAYSLSLAALVPVGARSGTGSAVGGSSWPASPSSASGRSAAPCPGTPPN